MHRRLITDKAEVRDLDRQLLEGLQLYLERNCNVQSKETKSYSIEVATAELDAILAKAAEAFVPADRLVDLMESRIAAIRTRQTVAYFVAANVTRVGGDGGICELSWIFASLR